MHGDNCVLRFIASPNMLQAFIYPTVSNTFLQKRLRQVSHKAQYATNTTRYCAADRLKAASIDTIATPTLTQRFIRCKRIIKRHGDVSHFMERGASLQSSTFIASLCAELPSVNTARAHNNEKRTKDSSLHTMRRYNRPRCKPTTTPSNRPKKLPSAKHEQSTAIGADEQQNIHCRKHGP